MRVGYALSKAQEVYKKKTLNNKDLLLTDQNYQSNHTGLHFNSFFFFEHTGSVRELYINLHFIQNKDTANRHSCFHLMTGTQHIQT